MTKKRPTRFWIVFWLSSALFFAALFAFLELRNRDLRVLEYAADLAPVEEGTKDGLRALVSMAEYVLKTDGRERTFLILFQNNLEIRPGGGFIGSFGILKVRDGQLTGFDVHDTINFDERVPHTVPAPYPMPEGLRVTSLQLRDSNWSPDFAENVRQAEYFYRLGQGREQFDGVVAITANVLPSFLRVIGPVEVPGYPGTYTAENAVLDLEEQVERNFVEQGIERRDRKSVMGDLGREVLDRAKHLGLSDQYRLFETVLEDLRRKDVQLFFRDEGLQRRVEAAGWDGRVDASWNDDYLMAVDANMAALKSDYYVKRSMDYSVDLSGAVPRARLAITYAHTAEEKSWLTRDYLTYLRVYVPKGSWLHPADGGAADARFGEELGKKYFGILVRVPLGTSKTVVLEYDLPKDLPTDFYDLKIQKQPGVNDVPVRVRIVRKDGTRTERELVLNRDWTLSDEL
jgi:hypothetical protein